MTTFRQRLTNALLGDEKRRLQEATLALVEAARWGPAVVSPERLLAQLREQDSWQLDHILQQAGWDLISGGFLRGLLRLTEQDRVRAVERARYMTFYDSQSAAAVRAWTNFGFGQRVAVVPRDPAAVPVWDEFWHARRNAPLLKQRRIHKLSDAAAVDGELFFAFWTAVDGETTLRRIGTEFVSEIVTVEDDPDVPLYYVQQTESSQTADGKRYDAVYYPDWQATSDQLEEIEIPRNAIRADELRDLTTVVVLHATLNEHEGRGWPQFKQAYEWFTCYRDFLGDRAAVARKAAMYTDKLTIKGGSRAIDAIAARLTSAFTTGADTETNPPPAAAADWLQNEAVNREWMTRDTGAAGARIDGMTILGQGATGTGVPIGWARPDAFQNRATAEVTMLPWYEQIERYQNWWASVLADVCEIVLTKSGKRFETTECDVTLDAPLNVPLDDVARLMGAATGAAASGAIDSDVASRFNERLALLALLQLGVEDADEVVELETDDAAGVMAAVALALENYRAGAIELGQLGEFALLELMDGQTGEGDE